MSSNNKHSQKESIEAINQYYMEIINAMPNVVYWVDKDCNLKGCNRNFCNLLGLQNLKDLQGTPYQKMIELGRWSDERVEALRLDDMKVLFSGEALHNIQEKPIQNDAGKVYHFHATRVPMHNKNREIVGLVVVLTDGDMSKMSKEVPRQRLDDENKDVIEAVKDGYLPTVLMVEDNLIAQNVEKALLTSLRCKVDIAETADIAMKLFSPGKYDLVLMDIGLEDSSGYVVAKQLRQQEKDTDYHVPIIALTSYEADVVKYDCEHYFMEGVLSKPLTSEQAEQLINHYVFHMKVPVDGLKSS